MQNTDLTGKWNGALTRTAPDGRSQTIAFMFDLTHDRVTRGLDNRLRCFIEALAEQGAEDCVAAIEIIH